MIQLPFDSESIKNIATNVMSVIKQIRMHLILKNTEYSLLGAGLPYSLICRYLQLAIAMKKSCGIASIMITIVK
jgi:uncharacterized protein (UPF0276 family)